MNRPLLPVCVRSTWYALDAPLVVEVLGKRPWVPIPGASARSPGVIAWQGRAIAMVDLSGLSDSASPSAPTHERLIVVRVGPSTLAIAADAVREVHDLDEAQFRPPRLLGKLFASAEVELDGKLVPVLDVASLVGSLTSELEATAS